MGPDPCVVWLLVALVLTIVSIVSIVAAPRLGFRPSKGAKELAEIGLALIILLVPSMVTLELYYAGAPAVVQNVVCIGILAMMAILITVLWLKFIKQYFPDSAQSATGAFHHQTQNQYPAQAYVAQVPNYTKCIYCGADFPPGVAMCARCGAKR
jgi:hypothetical protein